MNKSDPRPVNLDLRNFAFPATAIASILHRVSGVILFFGLIPALYLFRYMQDSASRFDTAHAFLLSWYGQVLAWGYLLALFYHTLAGVRHMFMDLGFWEDPPAGRASAWAAQMLALLAGLVLYLVWIWQ